MPPKSKIITSLSPEQRVELSKQIIASGFTGFAAIAQSWNEQGIELGAGTIRGWAGKLQVAILSRRCEDPNIALVLRSLELR